MRLASGRRVLPVFGFEEEAWLFARLASRDGRAVRRVAADELASLLRGPLAGADHVALDPLAAAEADVLNPSVCLTRRRFLDFLLLGGVAPGSPGRRTP